MNCSSCSSPAHGSVTNTSSRGPPTRASDKAAPTAATASAHAMHACRTEGTTPSRSASVLTDAHTRAARVSSTSIILG